MSNTSPNEELRADVFLVEHGYAKSRTEAQSAIRSGHVRINGQIVSKPSHQMSANASVEYIKPHPYVSRGALKLVAALDRFELSPRGLVGLDIGASTGGFTEILLERGARRVYAVDVGHGQLAGKLKRDERVVTREGVNARDLNSEHVPEPPQAIVADVSFIGLKLALPPALAMAPSGAWLVALVKPQFEVGRFAVGKGGIVRDAEAQEAALTDLSNWLNTVSGWSVLGHIDSPVEGGDGNREFLLAAKKA
jgi:23S rRNA (cytidine1920-2'-O)/16S rRNA (cytidine1409-2'-O)-methyltransferase